MSLARELLTRRSNFRPATHAESPYSRAREEWNDRLGSLVSAARNWRLAAFGALCVAVLAVVGLILESRRSSVQPYYILVAESGEPSIVGAVPEAFSPTLSEIQWHIAQWLEWTRGIPLDAVVVKKNYQRALYFMRQGAANKLNAWAQQDGRLRNIGRETVEIALIGITPISGTASYQARWKETFRGPEGALKEEQRWSATFTVELQSPTHVEEIQRNPLGLYVKDFQWSREL